MTRTRLRLRRQRAGLLLAVAFSAVGLSACNANRAVVSTKVVPPPPGCDTGRVVVVGASLDLSGADAALGREYLTGLEMGIAKVDAGGGVPPHNSCFELMYKNNEGDPAIDNQAMLDLVNVEKAGIVVGNFLGFSTASYLCSLGVPAVSLGNLENTYLPTLCPNTFPMAASMESQAYVIGKTLAREKVRSVGLIVTNDPASRQGAANLTAVSTADGFSITSRATVTSSGGGAAAATSQVRAGHPEALVILDDVGAVASVLSERAAAGWATPVLAGPDATGASVMAKVGGETGGVSVVVPIGAVAGTGPAAAASYGFRKALLAYLNTSSIPGSIIPYAEAYDAMTMMGNAANGAMGVVATDVTTFLQNANYQGVLSSYTYTTGAHTGVSATDQTVVSLDSLANGLFKPAPEVKKTATTTGT